MPDIRTARPEEAPACVDLAEAVAGARRSGRLVQAALDRQELLVAHVNGEVVGTLGYRTDWFACTLVMLVSVRADWRRRGVARALYQALEERSPSPRLFSSALETDVAAIQMHRALGFIPSGHVDNLPQGSRELLFYRRRAPDGALEGGSGEDRRR
ncbi:MAG: GNAT family N-acetyltransferase [Candidatus Methylomirabilia bacterium]